MKLLIWITLSGIALSGCGGQGDFGRKPYSVIDDKILPLAGKIITHARKKPVSWYSLTYAEGQLRNAAERLVIPHGKPVFLEGTIRRVERVDLVGNKIAWNTPERYLARIKREKFASSSTRIAFIGGHIQDDIAAFKDFRTYARQVFRADAKRRDALKNNNDFTSNEITNATSRIIENRQLVLRTLKALDLRMRGYDKALRRTLLIYPDTAIDADGARLHALKKQVDRFEMQIRPYIASSASKHPERA